MSSTQARPQQTGSPRPASAAQGASAPRPPAGAQRRVRLAVSRVDPWSVLKLSFLLSVAVGIAIVVAAGVLWAVLDAVGVFSSVDDLLGSVTGGNDAVGVTQYVALSKVLSAATVIAVVDVVLLTALATLGAILYNIAAALVGGLHVTLTDD